MTAIDYILDGLEAALELARELGVRTVEIDRGLLAAAPADVATPARAQPQATPPPPTPRPVTPPQPKPSPAVRPQSSVPSRPQSVSRDLVFVHDRPLSPGGVEMMAKIITALGRTADNAPVIVAPPLPRARITVILGGLALRKYFPDMRGEPGQWQKTAEGDDVLVTYSPEYILRFATVTPAVQKIKKDMWHSLKAVTQRLARDVATQTQN